MRVVFVPMDSPGLFAYYTLVRVGSDLSSAERQAIPLLADDLAKNVTELLVDGTW